MIVKGWPADARVRLIVARAVLCTLPSSLEKPFEMLDFGLDDAKPVSSQFFVPT
jgi:hypothetical protein